jgi:hypothetical protein
MEAKFVASASQQSAPISQRRLKEQLSADDIGPNEFAGTIDGAIDMALGREVHDDVGLEIGQGGRYGACIANVALSKGIAGILRDRR